MKNDLSLLFGMTTVLCLSVLPFSSYVGALPLIQEEWNLTNSEAGLLFSMSMIGYLLASLILMPLTDRIGSVRIIMGSMIISSVAHILFPFIAYGLVSGLVLRFVIGAGLVGIYMPGARLVVARFAGKMGGTAMGLYVAGFYFGTNISLTLIGVLISPLGWRSAYFCVAMSCVVAMPIAFFVIRRMGVDSVKASTGIIKLSVLKNPLTRLFTLSYTCHAWDLYTLRVWGPPFMTFILLQQGHSLIQATASASTLLGILFSLGCVAPVIGGTLSDRLGRAQTAFLVVAAGTLCALGLGWMYSLPIAFFVVLISLYGFLTGADSAVYSTAIIETADQDKIGATLGVYAFSGMSGGAAGPYLSGLLLDLFTSPRNWVFGFSVSGVVGIVSLLSMYKAIQIKKSCKLDTDST